MGLNQFNVTTLIVIEGFINKNFSNASLIVAINKTETWVHFFLVNKVPFDRVEWYNLFRNSKKKLTFYWISNFLMKMI